MEALTVDVADDEVMSAATQQLAELRRVFADVEQKLKNADETPFPPGRAAAKREL